MDRKFVKLADAPTFYLVEDGALVRSMASMAEVYQVGLMPVEVVKALPAKKKRGRSDAAPLRADGSEAEQDGDAGDDAQAVEVEVDEGAG